MPARTLIMTITAAAALVSALAGCSSDETAVAAPPAKADLSNTSWSGPCAGAGLGAYTFDFGAGNTDGGTVRISFPDAKTVKTVQYTLQSDGTGHTSFTIAMDPPWKGGLQRDYRTLEMSYSVGDQPGGYHCSLVRLGTNGPNGTS
jgi:hypothetical protein